MPDVSTGLAAISVYGILLVVNNQVLYIVEKHPNKPENPSKEFVRYSFMLLFMIYIGLNLAFAQIFQYIWEAGIFRDVESTHQWIEIALIFPILIPQIYAYLNIAPLRNLQRIERIALYVVIMGYILDFYAISVNKLTNELSIRYTFAMAAILVIWYYLISRHLPAEIP
ncbi:hypothetical protein NF865_04655 [Thermococcus aggregans]|uniref:Uncharacterized protein n=1 Tax=Thermococcus aggregans TaxID=110163 RepID=A0A9E7SPE9_THEAG|nr:hypothetical protein [Thermococcus aggregans]USS41468.1 hypothetical protein NF865_04655 [Thermococcus aggregans]